MNVRVMHRTLVVTAWLIASGVAWIAIAQDSEGWSQFRGPVAGGGQLTGALPDEEFGLSLAWSRELGSGYSNISIADGRAVTMFASGDVDIVAAFDPMNGEEIWRYEIGAMKAGHDGSDDGPLSTPAISGDRVFALGPLGQFVALALEDGSEIWRRDLDEETATTPFHGFTSSPITAGDLVILATGGEGHALTAFDRATGEIRWSAGDDSATYQTPMMIELGGRSVLVAVTDRFLHGLDPQTGEIRFEVKHTEGGRPEETAHATPIDDQRFVVTYNRGAAMYRLTDAGIEELWRSNAFANSLAIPVLVGEHLYGFTGRFLTCAEVETGTIVWRSRPPGGRGLSVVDGRLAVVAASGDLVLVEASPEAYRELARIPAFENGDLATPSFSDGLFLVRNLQRMAAVRVDTSAAPQRAKIDPADHLKGEFGEWVTSVLQLPEAERQAAVDLRFAGVETSPLLEEAGLAHFFWRGQAEDVGLESNEVAPGAANGLLLLSGTDLFVRSAELDPRAQYTYAFTLDYGQPVPDPLNPYTVDNGFNVVSELRMPEWPASPHLEPPAEDAARGELDTFRFRSEILDNTRQIQVWRPSGYDADPEARYPLLVVNHGDNLLRGGLMRNTLDNLGGASTAPVIAVFVPRVAGPEYGGPQVDDYVRFLVDELVPHLDRHYKTDGRTRAIMGPGSAGVTAVYAALQHPQVFQRAAAQSFYPIEPAQERFPELIAATDPGPELVYLVWSRHDYEFPDGRSSQDATTGLAKLLRDGGIEVTEQIADYSPAWGGWRGQHDEILMATRPFWAH